MKREPYRSARRVFWIADGGSSHRGQTAVVRRKDWYRNAVLVHTPVHASWLNQIEIYFSIVQRKALMPNDFTDLKAVEKRLLDFQRHYEKIATPFEWKFTREDLRKLLLRLEEEKSGNLFDKIRKLPGKFAKMRHCIYEIKHLA
jgi:DDE superfamily endonuclease